MATTTKWQVAQGTAGWHQLGKKGPERKCGAHYVTGKSNATACGRLPVRGTTPSTGMQHYGLRWFAVAKPTGALCVACKRLAPAKVQAAPQQQPAAAPQPVAAVA